eukprot:TRINITY_DN13609_c0_g1_i1.p1 TRINITY_DN13609_c0_g1~~TRINITY_DN13609_c0_g1_i1.p1  ORF type:complete len:1225 (-),score=160.08 TRINITY_DN13609_c0_g1_i1:6-3422(-)
MSIRGREANMARVLCCPVATICEGKSPVHWTPLGAPSPTSAPIPRSFHTCVAWKQWLHVFGGLTENGCTTNELLLFDVQSGTWSTVGTPVFCKTEVPAAAGGTHGSTTGTATSPEGVKASNRATTDPEPVAMSATAPAPRCCHSAVLNAQNSRMLVFGGFSRDGDLRNDCWAFKFGQGWELLPAGGCLPSPRFGHSAILHDEVMFVFGGKCAVPEQPEPPPLTPTPSEPRSRTVSVLASAPFATRTPDLTPESATQGPPLLALHLSFARSDRSDAELVHSEGSDNDDGPAVDKEHLSADSEPGTPRSSGAASSLTVVQHKPLATASHRMEFSNELYAFDLRTQLWILVETTESSPFAPVGHSAMWVANDELYLFGGEYSNKRKSQRFLRYPLKGRLAARNSCVHPAKEGRLRRRVAGVFGITWTPVYAMVGTDGSFNLHKSLDTEQTLFTGQIVDSSTVLRVAEKKEPACFIVHLREKNQATSLCLSAVSDAETDEWIAAVQRVIATTKLTRVKPPQLGESLVRSRLNLCTRYAEFKHAHDVAVYSLLLQLRSLAECARRRNERLRGFFGMVDFTHRALPLFLYTRRFQQEGWQYCDGYLSALPSSGENSPLSPTRKAWQAPLPTSEKDSRLTITRQLQLSICKVIDEMYQSEDGIIDSVLRVMRRNEEYAHTLRLWRTQHEAEHKDVISFLQGPVETRRRQWEEQKEGLAIRCSIELQRIRNEMGAIMLAKTERQTALEATRTELNAAHAVTKEAIAELQRKLKLRMEEEQELQQKIDDNAVALAQLHDEYLGAVNVLTDAELTTHTAFTERTAALKAENVEISAIGATVQEEKTAVHALIVLLDSHVALAEQRVQECQGMLRRLNCRREILEKERGFKSNLQALREQLVQCDRDAASLASPIADLTRQLEVKESRDRELQNLLQQSRNFATELKTEGASLETVSQHWDHPLSDGQDVVVVGFQDESIIQEDIDDNKLRISQLQLARGELENKRDLIMENRERLIEKWKRRVLSYGQALAYTVSSELENLLPLYQCSELPDHPVFLEDITLFQLTLHALANELPEIWENNASPAMLSPSDQQSPEHDDGPTAAGTQRTPSPAEPAIILLQPFVLREPCRSGFPGIEAHCDDPCDSWF